MEAHRQANDELEPLNRTMFDVNMGLDKAVLKPVAYVYKEAMPKEGREAVGSFLSNLRSPVILANDLMQGEWSRAGDTVVRFLANSTFGLGGLVDVAADMGFARHDEDFGQTLAVWGVQEGPYLMIPLFGPSNPRDAVGRVVDFALDPLTWVYTGGWGFARFGTTAMHVRADHYDELNDLEKSSLDFYAAIRSLYRQKRNDDIRNGGPSELPGLFLTRATSHPEAAEETSPSEQPASQAPAPGASLAPTAAPTPMTSAPTPLVASPVSYTTPAR